MTLNPRFQKWEVSKSSPLILVGCTNKGSDIMEIGRQNLSIGEEALREIRQGISKDEGVAQPQSKKMLLVDQVR